MSYFFNSNQTGFCQTTEVISKISNLTASYAAGNDGGQEMMAMVSGPIIMLILIVLFLCGTFDVRAVLSPNLRLLLSSALALFLPVMSYLFSEAKDAAGGGGGAGCQRSTASNDLSVRARVILTWMLLVELLRKKVDEMRMWGSYSSSIQRAGRVVWLGSLVYFNITSPGRKAVFSILWILCAVKLLQRIVFTEVEKRSYPDKSWLISSYMAEIMPRMEEIDDQGMAVVGDEFLKRCDYIVMGEEKLVGDVTADGYKLNIDAAHGHHDDESSESDSGIITVGKVWRLAETDRIFSLFDRNASIRRVCLSFAFFKLLRRRFEHLPPMTALEGRSCRKLMLSGRLSSVGSVLFSVMADEVKFFSEYYHSVVPVVLASPLFVLVNYFLVPIVVLVLCLIAIVVCGNGDMSYALSSMSADNYALQPGFAKLAICTLVRAGYSRPAFFFTLDLLVTLMLLIIFFAEEIWEFLTVLISNWFIISMVSNYVNYKPYWRASALISGAFRWTLWLRRKMSKYTNIRLKQFSLLSNHRGPQLIAALVPGTLYPNVTSVPMTAYLKLSIGGWLLAEHYYYENAPLAVFGRACRLIDGYDRFLWAYRSESVTEVILTWHIATCLLEATDLYNVARGGQNDGIMKEAAVSLSRYCAYLVIFRPELLPDRRAKAELVLKGAKEELRNLLGFWGYYLSLPRARAQKLFDSTRPARSAADPDEVVHRGIRLAKQLCDEPFDVEGRWKVLSDVWTELIVYLAPAAASDEEHVRKAHADILAEGVELITVLWAFAMHTGMERHPRSSIGRPGSVHTI